MDRTKYEKEKRRVHRLLTVGKGGRGARIVDRCIGTLILANALAVVIGTVPGVTERYGSFLYGFEVVSVSVFSVEYVARVWSCTADGRYAGPIGGRVRFATRPALLVDLLAVAPFYLGTAMLGADLRILRALRLVRFLRLVKLVRYAEATARFRRVYHRKRDDLVLTATAAGALLLVASSLMYFAEHGAQPEKFSSIPAALWWGVVTLTTVGYGDVYPVTPIGRLLGGLIAALGVGLFALPASVLASGFFEDREREREGSRRRCPHCGEPFDENLTRRLPAGERETTEREG